MAPTCRVHRMQLTTALTSSRCCWQPAFALRRRRPPSRLSPRRQGHQLPTRSRSGTDADVLFIPKGTTCLCSPRPTSIKPPAPSMAGLDKPSTGCHPQRNSPKRCNHPLRPHRLWAVRDWVHPRSEGERHRECAQYQDRDVVQQDLGLSRRGGVTLWLCGSSMTSGSVTTAGSWTGCIA